MTTRNKQVQKMDMTASATAGAATATPEKVNKFVAQEMGQVGIDAAGEVHVKLVYRLRDVHKIQDFEYDTDDLLKRYAKEDAREIKQSEKLQAKYDYIINTALPTATHGPIAVRDSPRVESAHLDDIQMNGI